MKTMTIVCLFLAISELVLAQAPDFLWSRVYASSANRTEVLYCVIQTVDGGYLATGYTYSIRGRAGGVLIKTNSNGDTLWTRVYSNTQFYSVRPTSDGGYILAGDGYNLFKVDANGDSLWSCMFEGFYIDSPVFALQIADGNYVTAGHTMNNGAGMFDFWLTKTGPSGDSLWSRTYGRYHNEECSMVLTTLEGGYLLVGLTQSFEADNGEDFYVVKTDGHGDSLWTRKYGGTNTDICYGALQTPDGGFVLAGQTSSFGGNDCWLLRISSSGDSLWSRTFHIESNNTFSSISPTSDGGFLLSGNMSDNWGNTYILLIKTDSNGNQMWYYYDRYLNWACYSLSAIEGVDGSIIASGNAQFYQMASSMMWKTGPDGPVYAPSELVIQAIGNDLQLTWPHDLNRYHRIYSKTNPNGVFTSHVGSTSDTTYTIVNGSASDTSRFYYVVGSRVP